MPSRNSVNKPKFNIHRASHAAVLGQRRAARARSSTRSSTSRYNEEAVPKPTESKAVGLYKGSVPTPGSVTNKTLSNKRARKIARNQKYVEKRNQRLQQDIEGQMQVDNEENKKYQVSDLVKIKSKDKTEKETERITKMLWDAVNSDMLMFKNVPDAEGTTIGVQSFVN